jgi:hypothetical protein
MRRGKKNERCGRRADTLIYETPYLPFLYRRRSNFEAPKSQKQRWELDRKFAQKRAESVRVAREAANNNQRMVYGRAQLGGIGPNGKGHKVRKVGREGGRW